MAAHICMVTVDHAPNDDRIFEKEAKSLKAAGFDVSVLCKADPDGRVTFMDQKFVYNPDGAPQFEIDGIPIFAVPADTSFAGKWLHKFQLDRFSSAFIQEGIALKADVYHAHEPISLYLAQKMADKNGAKVVFDSHESWIGGTRKEQLIKKYCLKELEYLITANTITEGHHLCLNPNLKTEVIYNFPDPEVFNLPFLESKFESIKIAHDGHLFFNRGLKKMVKVMELLQESHPRVQLKIIGEGGKAENQFLEQQMAQGLKNIEVTGWLHYNGVPKALQDCAIGLILKNRQPINNVLGGPAIKLFNYFASGMAVIDVGLPESIRFLRQSRSGIALEDASVDVIYRAIVELLENRQLLQQMCHNSLTAFEQFRWPSEALKLERFYREAVLNDNPTIFYT